MLGVYQNPVKTTTCYGPCLIAAGQHLPAGNESALGPQCNLNKNLRSKRQARARAERFVQSIRSLHSQKFAVQLLPIKQIFYDVLNAKV